MNELEKWLKELPLLCTYRDLSKVSGKNFYTVRRRGMAKNLGIVMSAHMTVLNKKEQRYILDDSLHFRGKRAKRKS
jgi:hypothetical protein